MRAKWSILAMFFSAGVTYVAYPYVTLYRLGQAIRTADAATLEELVDWPSVREGIKEDICDLVIDDGAAQQDGKLPAFGTSFMRGIASKKIDQTVTPQAIVAASVGLPASRHAAAKAKVDVHVDWAFFDSPEQFSISLRTGGLAEPIRLQMDLRRGEWKIRRVWVPAELLSDAPART